jgi:hypothetical protein
MVSTRSKVLIVLISSLVAISLQSTARADVLYTYEGNPFGQSDLFGGLNSCPTCSLSGWFTLPDLFMGGNSGSLLDVGQPLDYFFTDGLRSFSPASDNTNSIDIQLSTDPSGQIQQWLVQLSHLNFIPLCCEIYYADATWNYSGAVPEDDTLGGYAGIIPVGPGANFNEPGTWTIAVPEPSNPVEGGACFVSLLCFLALRNRRPESRHGVRSGSHD